MCRPQPLEDNECERTDEEYESDSILSENEPAGSNESRHGRYQWDVRAIILYWESWQGECAQVPNWSRFPD